MAKRRTTPARPVRPVAQVGGPREVEIDNAADRYGLIALSKNVAKLQARLQAEVEVAQKAFKVNQQQFVTECQEMCQKLGIDMTDQTVSIQFDDTRGVFVLRSVAQGTSAPVEEPASPAIEEPVNPDAQVQAQS